VLNRKIEPQPKSGKQEYLERLLNEYLAGARLRARERRTMKNIKGPAIFLAQFAGDAAPYNTLDGMAGWAASMGYKGIQIPTWDGAC
jgi:hypothetical protein